MYFIINMILEYNLEDSGKSSCAIRGLFIKVIQPLLYVEYE